jgi:hypothetical protein
MRNFSLEFRDRTIRLDGNFEATFAYPEAGTAPTDDGIRLHNRPRVDGTWHQTIQPNKDQAIHRTEGQSLRQMPALDVKLIDEGSGSQLPTRPATEQYDQRRPDQAVSFSHNTEALRYSASHASRIRLSDRDRRRRNGRRRDLDHGLSRRDYQPTLDASTSLELLPVWAIWLISSRGCRFDIRSYYFLYRR